jgi:hypothetical protein
MLTYAYLRLTYADVCLLEALQELEATLNCCLLAKQLLMERMEASFCCTHMSAYVKPQVNDGSIRQHTLAKQLLMEQAASFCSCYACGRMLTYADVHADVC